MLCGVPSLGVLHIIVSKELDLDLRSLLEAAQRHYPSLPNPDGLVDTVLSYVIERFKAWYANDKIATEVFKAVNAKDISKPLDFDKRVQAVHSFNQLEDAAALAAANKRVSNILAKQAEGEIEGLEINDSLLIEPAEKQLMELIRQQADINQPLLQENNYKQVLTNLAELRNPVDQFFDNVMVMVDDKALCQNRLTLLNQLRKLFLEIADISLLVPNK